MDLGRGVPAQSVYGKVETNLHLKQPNRFENCLFLDVARDSWNPDPIKAQMIKTVEFKRAFNAVTAIYLMWESDRLWDLYADLVSCYDFCIVTSSILEEYLRQRAVDFVRLRHPYDFALPNAGSEATAAPDELRFGISAGLWRRKNVSLLAEEFARTFKGDPSVQLSIHSRSDVNHPDFVGEYQKLMRIAGEFPRMEIVNRSLSRDEYLEWLRSIDVYCFVSSGEGYSVTPREALHLKTPVLLHDAHVHAEFSHLPGIVRVSSTGLQTAEPNILSSLYDIGNDWRIDRDELSRALSYCRNNYPTLKSEIECRYAEILDYHDLSKVIKDWQETLNQKYLHYIDLVQLDYPQLAYTSLQSDPCIPAMLSLGPPHFKGKTGEFVRRRVYCFQRNHGPGHCLYGPDICIEEHAKIEVIFELDVFCAQPGQPLANLDIYDNANDVVLDIRSVYQSADQGFGHDFNLTSLVRPGQVLEFRVYWFGTSDICVSGVEVKWVENEHAA